MATIEYSLFRAKFIRPVQASFFYAEWTPAQVFVRTLLEKPSTETRAGYIWHIGNVQFWGDDLGYFAVGRTTKATIEKFDAESGNFVEEELETSPYTHCVFDARIGLLGIARKPSLARTSKGIATRIEQLLSFSLIVEENGISVEIAPIPDPEGFLHALSSAFRVTRYSATFHGPNPFDADELFQKPLSVYLASANGKKGKAQIQGEDLDRAVLESVTRSTAATGNEASARIRKRKSQIPITINLKGDPVKRSYEEDDHQPEVVLRDLTRLYYRVKKTDETS
jgi:hypothetical protein